MILFKNPGRWHGPLLVLGALALTACVSNEDDTTYSRLNQTPSATPRVPVEAGDVVIAGQDFAHAIRDLPEIANAPKPPLVQFTGVTSIVGPEPVDTANYTSLLRDRLVVGTYQKLRFVERELPPLIVPSSKKVKSHKDLPPPVEVHSDPDFQILAELRGRSKDDLYKLQIQLVDFHTGTVLYDGLYHIRKEMEPMAPDPSNPTDGPNAANSVGGTPSYPPPSAETGAPAQR